MNDKKVYRKICPRCNIPCHLRAVSSFDNLGEKYGAIFVCPQCGWDDWGHILNPNDIIEIYEKEPKEIISDD